MKKLLGLMDKTNPNDQIMSAELFRELGCFEDALEILKLDRDDYGEVLSQLENFCKAIKPVFRNSSLTASTIEYANH